MPLPDVPTASHSSVPQSKPPAFAKRALDVILSILGLGVLFPALGLIAIAVRATSRGPALFVQERLGRGGRTFMMYKFRTMTWGAPDLRNPDGTTVASATDSRVTRLGRFLRRSSLDELPQFLNVLIGDMSLVGPRPELPDGLVRYAPEHLSRLEVPPGITGWAAINGRNDLSLSKRRDLDVWYVQNQSLRLDLRILLLTAAAVLRGAGVNRTKPHLRGADDR